MSFTLNTFQFNRGVASCANNGTDAGTVTHGYKSTTDNYVTITAPGYFPPHIDGSTDKIFVGDTIMIVASDTVGLVLVTALSPFAVGANLLGTAGSPIVMNVPIAATDANGIQISGTMVQLEIADAMHPGAVTQFAQVFGGQKMFAGGLTLPTSGGVPTALTYYEEYIHTTAFFNNLETSAPIDIAVVRVGSQVTLQFLAGISVPGQAAPGPAFEGLIILPTRFRPTTLCSGYFTSESGGVRKAGAINVDNGGFIEIFYDSDFVTHYPALAISGFTTGSISYTTLS